MCESIRKAISSLYSVDCGSNVISNVKIRDAEAALTFVVGDVSLQNVEIATSQTALSLPSKSSLRLTSCKFHSNQFAVNAVDARHVNISSCALQLNQNAVLLRQVQLVNVEDCLFSGNTRSISVSSSSSHGAIFIKRSRFDHNAVEMTAEQAAELSASVEDCHFSSSQLAVNGHHQSLISSVVVANSTFQSSGVRIGGSVPSRVWIFGCSFRRLVSNRAVVELSGSSLHNVTLAGNVFEENRRAPCVNVEVLAAPGYITPGLISIVGNSFANNSRASVIVINDRAYHHMELLRNAFENPLCPFEIEVQSPWRSGYAVNASENWWGSANRKHVADRISDVFVDSQKAKVGITSFYSDREMTRLEVFPDLRTWNVTGDKLVGGELDRNVTLASSNTSYYVNKSIYIPRGFQLQLEGNITLHFAERRGIIVEGKCA